MTAPATAIAAPTEIATVGDLLERLGGISPYRVRLKVAKKAPRRKKS